MSTLTVEQAVLRPGVVARSPGFADEWVADAERLAGDYGPPPAAGAVFARPLGPQHAAVVRAADRYGAACFHVLILPLPLYRTLNDPFTVADRFPPPWDARGELPALEWAGGPLPPRRVGDVQDALRTGDSVTLLGAAQALVDGGPVVFERPAPDPDLVRRLWLLLPASTRAELWPAEFAPANALRFDLLVTPKAGEDCAGYLSEQQAGDYPEGRYELNLQIAAEAGDQAALDALFARRSGRQTIRLALVLIAVALVLAVAMRLLGGH